LELRRCLRLVWLCRLSLFSNRRPCAFFRSFTVVSIFVFCQTAFWVICLLTGPPKKRLGAGIKHYLKFIQIVSGWFGGFYSRCCLKDFIVLWTELTHKKSFQLLSPFCTMLTG
jgi:hypothetical protein